MIPHEGYITQDNVGNNGWARMYIIPSNGSEVAVIGAQHLFEASSNELLDNETDSLVLGCVLAPSLKDIPRILKNGQYDKGNATSDCVLNACRVIKTSTLVEDMKTVARERDLKRIVTYTEGLKVHNAICRAFESQGFKRSGTEHVTYYTLEL